ncbi:histidinol dehydrogenase [Iodidimonas sp. SYSU 1G8]|uniref:histidinol dehydrogenase n=1 Tax=Iodidimonas sp. SYSU 1G8 TaxID=3133967 RepID=UPI0031FF13CA
MPRRLDASARNFEQSFQTLLGLKRESDPDVAEIVADIIGDVRQRGDEALFEYTSRFDRIDLSAETVRVRPQEILEARESVSGEALDALRVAAERIRVFHEKQKPEDLRFTDAAGVVLGYRWTPIDAVGLYVPGGTAAYPSSVLMNAIPARVAGVPRLAMVVPTPDGILNPMVLAAASTAGVGEIYKVGGAQAVAALAYGTESIAPVDKVVGPGNAFVAAAKRQVFGTIGIDMIAGPSEILVVADGKNDPAWIAADLLSQAEHDTAAQSILITDDPAFADAVERAVEIHLQSLGRTEIARASWNANGAIILVKALHDAAPLVDRIAPEHLELAMDDAERFSGLVRHAGAIFLGRHTPEAIGDYIAGPNHVLPTSRTARFASGLSVLDFLKRTTLISCDAASLDAIAPAAELLAHLEGLDAHALSMEIRRR